MTEIEKIRKRINKRKNGVNVNGDIRKIEGCKSSKLFKLLMAIMTVYGLFMSFAIYAKKDEQGVIVNNIFNTDVDFSQFNKTLNKLLNLRIMENGIISNESQVVNGHSSYINVGGDYFTNDDNLVIAQDDGVITYVNGKDDNYTIIIEYDSGIRATYSGVYEANVFVNDRIYKDDILGSFFEKVEIVFIKDNKKITYEEVISTI